MNSYFLEAPSLHFHRIHRLLRLSFCKFVLSVIILVTSFLLHSPFANAQEAPAEGGTLPGVTITEAEARNIMKGLFDFTRFSHTMAIGKIARDERLTAFTDGFVQRNNIEVLTIGYIDSEHFWPRVFREQRLAKIEKTPTDNLLAAKIIFMPDETDGTINGYNVTLELSSKSQQVYELLQVSSVEIDSIASQTSQQQLGATFATPSEAKETVVNALIAALQGVEAAKELVAEEIGTEEVMPEEDVAETGSEVIVGLKQDAELLSIASVTNPFTPGETRMEVTYTVKDTLGLDYVRLSLHRVAEGDTTEVATFANLTKGVAMELIDSSDSIKGWSGTTANGQQVEPGAYFVKLTGSVDEQAANGYFDFSPVEVGVIEEVAEEDIYNFIVSDGDAWYREKETPYKAIKPDPPSNILAQGLQVTILEVVKDGNDKDVAKLKPKDSEETEYTTLSNLTEVKELPKELKYKMVKDYTALKLPYSADNTDDIYKKDAEFTAYKVCGDYVKVKGKGGEVEGHWISKEAAVVDCGTGFCCQQCGRDLTVTLDKLKTIFDGNHSLTQTQATYFNTALKTANFSTCKQHAHFFSQAIIESDNFRDFEEDYWYRLVRIYDVFGGQSGNESYKTLYSQEFWDNENHLNYIGVSKDEHLKKKKGENDTTGVYNSSTEEITKTRIVSGETYTIKFPKSFSLDKEGDFVKASVASNKKSGENLFNLVYDKKNGNNQTGDGWKYRGRGIIQVTGRSNYKTSSDKANKVFTKSYNWETNPDQLMNDDEAKIYSAAAWFLNNFNPITILDHRTSNQVTGVVNSKREKMKEREEEFNRLRNDSDLYKGEDNE